ncbi:MAG: hypothetical protein A2041_00570 [Bacteroidetes bacterium GWA2_31_9b]|nr:MAG: hypothetical protein A2041_00570 [Bacteroidetes bacterium GWA2_31_9b]
MNFSFKNSSYNIGKDKFNCLKQYLIKPKKYAIWGGVAMIFNILLMLPTPLITMYLIDQILPQKDFPMLSLVSGLLVIFILFKFISSYFQNLYFVKFNELVIFHIQIDLNEKIQSFTARYRQKLQTGYLMSRISNDPNRLHGLFATILLTAVSDILTFIVGLIIIFFIHWKLALASLFILPFFIYAINYFSKKIRDTAEVTYEESAQVYKKMQESISLIDTFLMFNAQKYDAIKLVQRMRKSVVSYIHLSVLSSLSMNIAALISGIGPVVVIWYGMYEIMNGNLTLGELIAFNAFIGYLFGPANRLMNANSSIQQSLAAWDRIYEILNEKKNVLKKSKKNVRNKILGHVSFQNVAFSYDDQPVLKNINLEIAPKSILGIVGESGCGKSTLVSLIPVLNEKNEGEIFIDDLQVGDYNVNTLRDQIAYVNQEPLLFNNTILNNIKLGNKNASRDEIIHAAHLAKISDFIESLPDGYDSIVDERGLNMSVGQKQRIAIARAILKKPSILILDEFTSNLDSESEYDLFETLKDFMKERTTIIVAHRLSTLKYANKIVVLDKGCIVEEGSHQDLMKLEGSYSNLFNKQHANGEIKVLVN